MVKTLEQINQEFIRRFMDSCPEEGHFSDNSGDVLIHFEQAQDFENSILEEVQSIPLSVREYQEDANPFVRLPQETDPQLYSEKSFADGLAEIQEAARKTSTQCIPHYESRRQTMLILYGMGIAFIILDGIIFLLTDNIWISLAVLAVGIAGFFVLREYYGLGNKKLRRIKAAMTRLQADAFQPESFQPDDFQPDSF